MPDEGAKTCTDSQVCTWRELLKEMEDSGTTDYSVNCHDVISEPVGHAGVLCLNVS